MSRKLWLLRVNKIFFEMQCQSYTFVMLLLPLYARSESSSSTTLPCCSRLMDSKVPKKTAPPRAIHRVLGTTPRNKAGRPSSEYILDKVGKIFEYSKLPSDRIESMIRVFATSKGVVMAAAMDPARLPQRAASGQGRSASALPVGDRFVANVDLRYSYRGNWIQQKGI